MNYELKERKRRLTLLVALILSLVTLVTLGPRVRAKDYKERIDKEQERLEEIKAQIKAKEAETKKVEAQERSVLSELDEIDRKLDLTKNELKKLDGELKKAEREYARVTAELKETTERLGVTRAMLGRRLRAIYKEGRLRYFRILLTAEDYSTLVRRYKFIRVVALQDAQLFSRIQDKKEEIMEKKRDVENRRALIAKLRSSLMEKREEIGRVRASRTLVLKKLRTQRITYEKTIEDLKVAESRLQNLIKELERKRELEAKKGLTHLVGVGFQYKKGRLIWPTKGEVISLFGRQKHPLFNTYTFNQGINIKASLGKDILAVCGGTVIYADWFKGYGKLAILDHGNGYYTLYAHASELLAEVGEEVKEGQVIAKIGDTGSFGEANLYFEIRVNGKPVDPIEWLSRR